MPESIKILDWELTNESCQSCECSLFESQSDMEKKQEHSNQCIKEKPIFGLSPDSQGIRGNLRGRDSEQWWRQMANGRFLCAHCPAQTRFNLNNKSLQVSPTRFAYNSPWSSCNVPLWENVTAHRVHYSPTLVRRRIKCHFDSFPIWSKFLLDKMQITAIIWQVIWWCRRYGGYA